MLGCLGETPVTKRKLQSKKYKERKLEVLTTKMSEVLLSEKQNDESEMLQQLKEESHSTSQNNVKVQILTVLPRVGPSRRSKLSLESLTSWLEK